MFVVNKSKENIFFIALYVVLCLLITTFGVCGGNLLEKYYQEIWCDEHQGKVEVVLKDGTRCDCLTSEYSVEFDFGKKWAESLGQSLFYSILTKNKAGIVLILKSPRDEKFVKRLQLVIETYKLPVTVWTMKGY